MDSGSLTECVAFLLPCVPAAHPIWGASEYVQVGAHTSTRQLLAIKFSGYMMESRYEIIEYRFVFEFVIVKGKSSVEQNALHLRLSKVCFRQCLLQAQFETLKKTREKTKGKSQELERLGVKEPTRRPDNVHDRLWRS